MQILLDLIFPLAFNGIFLGVGGLVHPATVWFSFAVINIAYFLILASKYMRHGIHEGLRSSEHMVLIAHMAAQFVWGMLCILFKIGIRANIVVVIVIAAGFAVAYLALNVHNTKDTNRVNDVMDLKQYLNQLAFRVENCRDTAKDPETKKRLDQLCDALNCAQVADSSAARAMEKQVEQLIAEIEVSYMRAEPDKTVALINQAIACMKQREKAITKGL